MQVIPAPINNSNKSVCHLKQDEWYLGLNVFHWNICSSDFTLFNVKPRAVCLPALKCARMLLFLWSYICLLVYGDIKITFRNVRPNEFSRVVNKMPRRATLCFQKSFWIIDFLGKKFGFLKAIRFLSKERKVRNNFKTNDQTFLCLVLHIDASIITMFKVLLRNQTWQEYLTINIRSYKLVGSLCL